MGGSFPWDTDNITSIQAAKFTISRRLPLQKGGSLREIWLMIIVFGQDWGRNLEHDKKAILVFLVVGPDL